MITAFLDCPIAECDVRVLHDCTGGVCRPLEKLMRAVEHHIEYAHPRHWLLASLELRKN